MSNHSQSGMGCRSHLFVQPKLKHQKQEFTIWSDSHLAASSAAVFVFGRHFVQCTTTYRPNLLMTNTAGIGIEKVPDLVGHHPCFLPIMSSPPMPMEAGFPDYQQWLYYMSSRLRAAIIHYSDKPAHPEFLHFLRHELVSPSLF